MLASNKTHVALSVLVLLLVSICCGAAISKGATNELDELKLSELRTELKEAQAEAEMIAQQIEVGVAGRSDLVRAEIKVESLRTRLARHEEDWTRALDALGKVVAGRKRILDSERQLQDEGLIAAHQVDVSRVDLSQSRIVYELMTIICICQRDVDLTTSMAQRGVAPRSQLLRAEDELNKACALYDDMCKRFRH